VALVAGVVWLVVATASPAAVASGRQVEVSSTGSAPALAYNAEWDEFLVVWSGGEEQPVVMGRRLDGDGTPIAPAFSISSGRGRSPAVAYDRRRNRYLVAWSTGSEIRGQWVSAHAVRLPGEELVIAQPPAGFTGEVALSYNAVAHRYLVAWVVSLPTVALVFARQLDAAGMALQGEMQISSGCGVNAAASAREPGWLVAVSAFCTLRDLPGAIIAARVGVAGVESSTRISGTGIAPGGFRAGVAFAPGRQEYLAAWWSPGGRFPGPCPGGECVTIAGVYGQRLSSSGAQVGPDDFTISTWALAPETARTTDVAVAYDRRSRRYLVVWEGVVADGLEARTIEILGQYLRPTGIEVPPDDFQISAMAALDAHAAHAVVAARTRRGGHLVAWERETSLVSPRLNGVFVRWLPNPRRRGP
jgi:hypothetical protein